MNPESINEKIPKIQIVQNFNITFGTTAANLDRMIVREKSTRA